MKIKTMFAIALFVASAAAGCAEPQESKPTSDPSCEGASSELGELSCLQGKPVNEVGLAPDELSSPLPVRQMTEEEAAKAARTYTGACTGIWYGCSRVTAEGWTYESCGSSHYVFMTFDGPYGNLVGYGIGYCWF
jgi:hypothetical protein